MSIDRYEDLNDMQLDVLKEIGNIGSGNATTALSAMIGKMVDIEVPRVQFLNFQDAIDAAGGAEKNIAGVLVRINGDIDGMILFLFEFALIDYILGNLFGKKIENIDQLDDIDRSALKEIGNIMASSYVNAIAQLAGMNIFVDIPELAVDMLGAIVSVPAVEVGEISDKLLFIDNNMIIDKVNVTSKILLVPSVSSLGHIMTNLGVM
ncbi:MAG: chemotaxis protein CheC [Ruminiclostridium sp.]